MLPKFLCQSCYTKCNEWKIFRKLCENSEKYLIKCISKREQRTLIVNAEALSNDFGEDHADTFIHSNSPMTIPSLSELVSCLICNKQFVGEKEQLEHQCFKHTVHIPTFRKIHQCHIGKNVPKKQDGFKVVSDLFIKYFQKTNFCLFSETNANSYKKLPLYNL